MERDKVISALKQEFSKLDIDKREDQNKISDLESKVSNLLASGVQEQVFKRRKIQLVKYISKWVVVVGLLLATINYGIYHYISTNTKYPSIRIIIYQAIPSILLWIYLLFRFGETDQVIREIPFFKKFIAFRKWLYGSLLLPLIVNALWDAFKLL